MHTEKRGTLPVLFHFLRSVLSTYLLQQSACSLAVFHTLIYSFHLPCGRIEKCSSKSVSFKSQAWAARWKNLAEVQRLDYKHPAWYCFIFNNFSIDMAWGEMVGMRKSTHLKSRRSVEVIHQILVVLWIFRKKKWSAVSSSLYVFLSVMFWF